jgi:N-methylhydantoinase A
LQVPSPPEEINNIYAPMIEQARRQLKEEGFDGDKVKLEWSIDLRYSRQVHEVTTIVRGRTPLDEAALTQLVSDFEAQYERKYGKGSAFREAGIEMTMFRLTARGLIERPRLEPLPLSGKDCSHAKIGRRPIFVDARNGMADADIYDFSKLVPGNVVPGPAVIHTPITTIVLQEKQHGTMDAYRNVLIDFDP